MLKYFILLNLTIFFCFCSCDTTTQSNSYKVKIISTPVLDSSAQPYLFTDKNERIFLSWIEKHNKESTLKFSTFIYNNWTTPLKIATGNNWFVNWADYPVIATIGEKNMIALYLEKSGPSTFSYDVKYRLTHDEGKSWDSARFLNEDGKKAEHGFISVQPFGEKYFISWLDGRNTGKEKMDGHGQMTLRAATLLKNGTKEAEWELDNKVCDCCQTTVTITKNGPVVIYRDRSDEEIRDISIVRMVNGRWTKPQTIYTDKWKISGCPVNGPRADALNNNLAIAWFSIKDEKPEVKVVFSKDGGATFNTAIKIDEGQPIGRVDLQMLDENTAIVSWMEGSEIKAIRVNRDGSKGQSIVISNSSETRSSGFPQMTKSGNKILFAWTDNIQKTIKIASLEIE